MTIRRTLRELRRDKQVRAGKKAGVKPVTKKKKRATRRPRARK